MLYLQILLLRSQARAKLGYYLLLLRSKESNFLGTKDILNNLCAESAKHSSPAKDRERKRAIAGLGRDVSPAHQSSERAKQKKLSHTNDPWSLIIATGCCSAIIHYSLFIIYFSLFIAF